MEIWTMGVAAPGVAERSAERAERQGWDGMLVVDSQNLAGDPYVGLALAARVTERLRLGTGVTNPVTRHPAATAAAIASVQAVSGGRAVLGIGRGDSALAHLGAAPAPAALLERAVRIIRELLRGATVDFESLADFFPPGVRPVDELGLADSPAESALRFLPAGLPPVPVEVAATGPLVMRVGARCADRVMLAVGAGSERVAWSIDAVRAIRREAGLDSSAFPIGAYLNVVAHPDIDVARTLIAGGLATFARFSVMDGKVRTPIDDRHEQLLTDLHRGYDMTHHTEAGSPQTHRLTGEFIDRFGIAGTVDSCVERIVELAALGLDRVIVIGPSLGSDRDAAATSAKLFVDEVMPAVRERLSIP